MDNRNNDLLILDLDNTLIAAVNKAYIKGIDYNSDFMVMDDTYHVNMRPHLHEFMKYVFENWRVAIWTVASIEYTKEILSKSNIDIDKFEFIKVREDCTKSLDIDFTPIWIKDITKLEEDLSRVILVDDKKSSLKNSPSNLIEMPAYISENQRLDDNLLKLIKFLSEIKNTPDYRSVNKNNWNK